MMPASAAFSIFLSPLAALLVLAPALSAASCLHGTTLVPRSEHGAAGAAPAPTFGYSGAHGPLHWHTLQAPAYNKCARGRHQSPINIEPNATTITALHDAEKRPRLHYPHVPSAQLHNLGTTLQTPVNGSLAFGGATWALKQFHFHTPSEHRLEEEYFPVEVHFVHERTS
jgi:carbonic anhydrase